MTLKRYLIERTVAFVVVLWAALLLVFCIFQVVPPGCGVTQAPDRESAPIQHRFCDGSVVARYGRFMGQVVDGSFGRSAFLRGSLRWTLLDSASVSVSVVSGALVFALLLGLGVALLARIGRAAGASARWFMYLAFGIHPLWLGLLLAYWIGLRWHLTSVTGYCDFFNPPRGECRGAVEWARHLILPWITLGLAFAAMYIQVFRALFDRERVKVLDAEPQERIATRKRARRQTVMAVATRLGRDFGIALGISLFVETIFSLPGLGRLLIQSWNNYDPPTGEGALALAVIIALSFDQLVTMIGAVVMPEWRTR
jgi:peptide/nickel transport system permease protein